MALTLKLQGNLQRVFKDNRRYINTVSTFSDEGSTFSRWLEVDLSKNDIEIPAFIKYDIYRLINGIGLPEGENVFTGKIYIPVQYGYSYIVKTGDAIINTLFNMGSDTFTKVNTTKGIYYGSYGIILDSNFNVLFLVTLNCHKEGTDILYTGANIYIHPKVFLEEKEILHSCILKKIIPFYLELKVSKSLLGFSREHPQHDLTPQIIIKDVTSDFINIANVPDSQSTSNESINQFLIDHQEDIIDQL